MDDNTTPLTDAAKWTETNSANSLVSADFARDLERKLAQCREALFIISCAETPCSGSLRIATKTLTETQP